MCLFSPPTSSNTPFTRARLHVIRVRSASLPAASGERVQGVLLHTQAGTGTEGSRGVFTVLARAGAGSRDV